MHQRINSDKEIDAIILCGGKGTRLKSVISDRPKPLAPIGEKAFLDFLIDHLIKEGIKRIILSVGYMKEKIIDYVSNRKDCLIEISEEDYPLGTGGALKKAQALIETEDFLVLNGDSFAFFKLAAFLENHRTRKSLVSFLITGMDDVSDYGSVEVDAENRLIAFREKNKEKLPGFINAGVYLMQKRSFGFMSEEDSFSLETDFFPKVISDYCYAHLADGEFIDIGVPERYERARSGNIFQS